MNNDEVDALKKERDELAARCDRLLWAAGHFDQVDECEAIMEESPAKSLARVRAEAIENAVFRARASISWESVESHKGHSDACAYIWKQAQLIRHSENQKGGDHADR